MPTANRRVVVTQRHFDKAAFNYLTARGCEVVEADLPEGQADGELSHETLVDCLAGAAGWIVGHARVTRELLLALPDLQVVSRRGVGYDRVDVAAARELGRVVCIAVGGNHESVADHTLALMLAVGHRLRETQATMAAGNWSILPGSDLYRKTVGIIGMGRIGRAVERRLRGFEAEVLYCGGRGSTDQEGEAGAIRVELDELLSRSDYVTVHAPLNPDTGMLLSGAALARMKPGSFVINTARGGLVDDLALLEALRSGTIAGAGLDVFQSEADPSLKPVTDALLSLPNLVSTPHAAASSRDGLDRTNMVAAQSVVAVLDGGDPAPECVVADGRSR